MVLFVYHIKKGFFFFFESKVTTLISQEGGWSEAFCGAVLFPLHRYGLLAPQDGADSADGGHVQTQAVLVFADCVSDTAVGGLGILVDSDLHIGGGRLLLARSLLHYDHRTFAISEIPTSAQGKLSFD